MLLSRRALAEVEGPVCKILVIETAKALVIVQIIGMKIICRRRGEW
jgi:hypothetical protein